MKIARTLIAAVALTAPAATASGAAAGHQQSPVLRSPAPAAVRTHASNGTASVASARDNGSTDTGLQNAIDHVTANLAAHPNSGLQNALTHLQANLAKHGAGHGNGGHGQGQAAGHPHGS